VVVISNINGSNSTPVPKNLLAILINICYLFNSNLVLL